jgi:hypothetical protein
MILSLPLNSRSERKNGLLVLLNSKNFTEKCTTREKIATFGHQVAVVENFFNIIYSVHVESSAETQVQNQRGDKLLHLIASKCFHGG